MKDKIKKIEGYIDNYKKCINNEMLNNYYDIFSLSKSSDINQLKNEVKKLRILFHPDLSEYIPSSIKNKFLELSKMIVDMDDVFDNSANKARYDSTLKKKNNKEIKVFTVRKLSDFEKFNYVVIDVITKYGFIYAFNAIYDLIRNNNYDDFCVGGNTERYIFELDKTKIKNMLINFRKDKETGLKETIISYFCSLIYGNEVLNNKFNSYIDNCNNILEKFGRSKTYYSIIDMYDNNNKDNFDTNLDIVFKDALILILIYFESLERNDPEYGCRELMGVDKKDMVRIFILVLESKLKNKKVNNGRK